MGGGGGDFLLIYALKMPAIDIHRYCHSRVARRPCLGQQPKLKLHFTVVFQVVAQLSRNFNIPRRERLKIQPATCHSIATFHATCPLPASSPSRFPSFAFISNPPPRFFAPTRRSFDGKSFVKAGRGTATSPRCFF